jgi:hypothetical protein
MGESYLQDPAPFVGEKLKGTLSPVLLDTKARAFHPMTGP